MTARLKTSDLPSDFQEITRKSEGFSLRIKEGREKLGISQQEFARKVGVSTTTIQNYEGGQFPKGEHALSLSFVLQMSLDFLFLGIEPIPQPAANTPEPPVTTTETAGCARCAKMEAELEKEREERRELSTELREVNAENRRMARENGDLREKCATLTERQKACCPEQPPLLRKPPAPSSEADLRR